MDEQNIEKYLSKIKDAFQDKSLIKLSVSKKRNKSIDIASVSAKMAEIKGELNLSFVYRYPTKDITKNWPLDESLDIIRKLLGDSFLQSELYTSRINCHFIQNKKGNSRLKIKENQKNETPELLHDRQKSRYIDASRPYFHMLGISTKDGKLKKDGQAKFKQINKFIETIKSLQINRKGFGSLRIYDMGSGKGYLSFALYDYLANTLDITVHMKGIEIRQELVDKCNTISQESEFTGLSFEAGYIEETSIDATDMLIALHACDTATDEAIAKGIKANAQYIICSPCCHKQLRSQLNPDNALKSLSQYGILKERQSEMVTDTIRALILEYFGYKTKIIEYISTEHTPKNIMIIGVKTEITDDKKKEVLSKIKDLKSMFGVQEHHLEKLLPVD